MTQKTGQEKLQEIEIKINQLETRKKRLENRIKEQKRKERTRRLIQVGAIFEKYFEFEGEEDAEKIALAYSDFVKKAKDNIVKLSLEDIQKILEERRKKQ